jgi:MFS family permease
LAAVIQASGQKKARAVSGYFLFAYLGLGLPCILTGFLADRFGVFYALAGSGFVMLMAFILIFTAIRAWFVSSSKTEAVRGPEWRTR